MIPYFQPPPISIGPLKFHLFSILVIVAILVARWIIARRARRFSLDRYAVTEVCVWMLIAGFVTAHVAKLAARHLPEILAQPSLLVKIGGIASIPGLAGGLLGGLAWSRFRRLSAFDTLRFLDVIAYSLPFAWIFGRLGCFLAHDHRGAYTSSWIGVQFPEGTRYDLGLTELLFLIPLAAVFYTLGRSSRPVGFFLVLYTMLYGLYRIWQDAFHIQPASFGQGRYGDTIGGSILCLVGLMGWAVMARYRRAATVGAARPTTVGL